MFCLTAAEIHSRRLDCIESENLSGVILSNNSERQIDQSINQYSHGTKFSDGDIYRKVREYQKVDHDHSANAWIQKLSKCKQIGLKLLLERKGLVKAFDNLIDFPGLWSGLELGNIRKILALHCDEVILLS